jgi:hypothetical protein
MDGVLSILAVAVGLLVMGWLFGPVNQRGRPEAEREGDDE